MGTGLQRAVIPRLAVVLFMSLSAAQAPRAEEAPPPKEDADERGPAGEEAGAGDDPLQPPPLDVLVTLTGTVTVIPRKEQGPSAEVAGMLLVGRRAYGLLLAREELRATLARFDGKPATVTGKPARQGTCLLVGDVREPLPALPPMPSGGGRGRNL